MRGVTGVMGAAALGLGLALALGGPAAAKTCEASGGALFEIRQAISAKCKPGDVVYIRAGGVEALRLNRMRLAVELCDFDSQILFEVSETEKRFELACKLRPADR